MARETRNWHPRFIQYMNMILHDSSYAGLPIVKKNDGTYLWVTTKQSVIGQQRIAWCEDKARAMGWPIQPGVYADVMLAIHPTKKKVCQICGREMWLYYLYPNKTFLCALNQQFGTDYTECDCIFDIWNDLKEGGVPEIEIARFLIQKGNLNCSAIDGKEKIVWSLEYACRKGSKACLGPGAMSNFPDRFDGFHSYNRCCRKSHDKGRSDENMRSYGKDRRAYEYWSDGNIHAADEFMHSPYFAGVSADHVGPISLGFVHDPRYLQRMEGSENSTKRDHLRIEDVDKMIRIEQRTGICAMSWYSEMLWDYIQMHYKEEPWKVDTCYKDALKQNMANYMYILRRILEANPTDGRMFLQDAFLRPHFEEFAYSYQFNEQGDIIARSPRHITERSQNEMERYCRIAFDSVFEYAEKDNRNAVPKLSETQMGELNHLCLCIQCKKDFSAWTMYLIALVNGIQADLIKTM